MKKNLFIPLEIIFRRLRRGLPLRNNPRGDSNTPREFLTGFINLTCGFGYFAVKKYFLACVKNGRGITLLITVVLLAAILSISLGVFSIIYAQFVLTGEIADSFFAFYAADQGIEKYLYLDRDGTPVCEPVIGCSLNVSSPALALGSCYEVIVTKNLGSTKMQIFGRYPCALGRRLVTRALEVNY